MSEVRALAWRIVCNHDLQVTIAVADRYVLLLSDDTLRTTGTPWRVGSYSDAVEAQRRAVEMTSSYERLRSGTVGAYAEVTLPGPAWTATIEEGAEVHLDVAARITEALFYAQLA